MFRWLLRIVLLLLVLLAGLALARNRIAAGLLRAELERVTRLPCSVGSVEVHLSSPTLEACAISIHNPPYGFRTPLAVGIRSLSARYSAWALLRGRLELSRVEVDVSVANCVRAPEGPTNLRGLQHRLRSAENGPLPLEVTDLSARLEKARYVDESQGLPRIQSVSRRETRAWRDLRGEEAVRKAAAAFLAQVEAADPFAAPPASPKPATPAKKAKVAGDGR
jgi:hypothetical protein